MENALVGLKNIRVGAKSRHSWVKCSPRSLDIRNHAAFKYVSAFSFSPHRMLNIYSMAIYLQFAGELPCEVNNRIMMSFLWITNVIEHR